MKTINTKVRGGLRDTMYLPNKNFPILADAPLKPSDVRNKKFERLQELLGPGISLYKHKSSFTVDTGRFGSNKTYSNKVLDKYSVEQIAEHITSFPLLNAI